MAFQAKRKFLRKLGREGVRIRHASGIEYGTYEDLSPGGLRLWMEHGPKVGELLEVEFDVPADWVKSYGRRSMQRPAKVVRVVEKSDAYEVGVQFLDVSSELARHWSSTVDGQTGPF